ncbi:hypothetical protein TraAM80_07029 [Trypanosoma rangeli]|uniref:Uncharacterized protein n=1 Tax=Trypanosoma rangeli TaxID=5698 RepID=A0A3R7K7T1_TRYRA|nr:uncharacterized protein TraAM80_07029 [Trypanosoma rangeli]RNF01381.1 hypothetical protein TraAM80_07029 [Trypanosoma rangeli]|eukprot:RNF01381.1 hypothetical protein TraAM80_07029 [Trypanosoma rangeli]
MPSNYAVASQCQLRRDEMHELLALSAAAGNGTETAEEDKLPLWRMLLTEAHVRSLLAHTLVRVSVPKNKQQQLIHGNKYVQANAQANSSTEGQQHHYRVGKVVALVPRPRASPGGLQTATDASPAASLLSEWLLGINFGETTDLLGAKYVSNEPFSAEEHAVFVRSCLSTRADTTTAASALMSAAEADVVVRNLYDIREYVRAVVAARGGKAAAVVSGAAGRKHPRDSAAAALGGTGNEGNCNDNEDDCDGEGGLLTREELLVERARHREERCRWESLRDEQQRHLSGLRQLLNSKNGEIQRVLHTQRQAEAEHRTEIEQWRAKTEQQGQTIRRTERMLAEEREVQRENREKTEKLVAQLKKLVEQTRRFKEVSDTVAEWLRLGTKQPEDVLASLKIKLAESQM